MLKAGPLPMERPSALNLVDGFSIMAFMVSLRDRFPTKVPQTHKHKSVFFFFWVIGIVNVKDWRAEARFCMYFRCLCLLSTFFKPISHIILKKKSSVVKMWDKKVNTGHILQYQNLVFFCGEELEQSSLTFKLIDCWHLVGRSSSILML